jgi:hypothetical protein
MCASNVRKKQVPTDQPEVALDMFSKWIDNKEF